jgi:poly(3-hydroxyalkanoate) synthetase
LRDFIDSIDQKKTRKIILLKQLLTFLKMKRSKELVEKRKDFVNDYVKRNQDKQMKVIVTELTEMLFLSERTIYNIIQE